MLFSPFKELYLVGFGWWGMFLCCVSFFNFLGCSSSDPGDLNSFKVVRYSLTVYQSHGAILFPCFILHICLEEYRLSFGRRSS